MQYSNATDGYPLDQILCGDNLELIRELPDRSVQLVITSPPYFQQRDYGGGMGNEACLEEYLDSLLSLFHECVRVVKDDGSLVFIVNYRNKWTFTNSSALREVSKVPLTRGI